ncbi:MAG: helix-turn-helix transcriptional regulator [Coprobacillus sp.]
MFNKDVILKLLEKKGWSRYKLSKESNLAQSTLSDILTGKNSNPRMDTIQKIATTLNVSVDVFFDNDSNCNSESAFIDTDIRRIERARNKMSVKDKAKMMKILEASFDDYFDDED